MSYVGNIPAEKYSSLTQQTFSSPTGTSFTLSQSVTNSTDIALFVDNVRQDPSTYTAVGTALTTSTISSPSTMYCLFNGKTTETVSPPAGSVDSSHLVAGSVDDSHITGMASSKLTGSVAVANGGTGATTHTANNVLVGNGTSAIASVAPSTSGNVLTSTGSAWASTAIPASGITLGTAVASTSGSSIDFTGIPSGTKRITFNCSALSTAGGGGASIPVIQLGDSGGFETSGYVGMATRDGSTGNTASSNYTNGFRLMGDGSGVTVFSGRLTMELLDASTNTWTGTVLTGRTDVYGNWGAGAKSLSGELTQIRLTHVDGTTAFDAGKVNIQYEG